MVLKNFQTIFDNLASHQLESLPLREKRPNTEFFMVRICTISKQCTLLPKVNSLSRTFYKLLCI